MTTPKRAMHCSNDISITSLRADSICMVSICTEGHSPSVAKLRGLTAYRCGSTEFIVAHTLFIVQYCFTRLSHLDITNSDLPSSLSLPRLVNIILNVKVSRNTACGHNDFCSVRLNGPICAKVSCPSGCCRIILPLLYLIATSEIV